MKNIAVFYHEDCLDGFGAAWAAWKKLGNKAEYIGISPKPFTESLKKAENKIVYFLDAAPDDPKTIRILKERNKEIIIIDHHITRKNILSLYSKSLFSLNHSGAVLSWQYFHPGKSTPELLSRIEDNDLWKFKMNSSKEIFSSLQIYPFNFQFWNKLSSDFENTKKRKKYIEEGKAIIKFTQNSIESLVPKASKVKFEGYIALAVNSSVMGSEIANYIVEKKGFPIGIIWSQVGKKIRVQLRSRPSIDVSRLAVKYGGGGHKNAAGFILDAGKPFPWKIIS